MLRSHKMPGLKNASFAPVMPTTAKANSVAKPLRKMATICQSQSEAKELAVRPIRLNQTQPLNIQKYGYKAGSKGRWE